MKLASFKPYMSRLCDFADFAVAVIAVAILVAVAIIVVAIAVVMTVSAIWVLSVKIGIPIVSSLF